MKYTFFILLCSCLLTALYGNGVFGVHNASCAHLLQEHSTWVWGETPVTGLTNQIASVYSFIPRRFDCVSVLHLMTCFMYSCKAAGCQLDPRWNVFKKEFWDFNARIFFFQRCENHSYIFWFLWLWFVQEYLDKGTW